MADHVIPIFNGPPPMLNEIATILPGALDAGVIFSWGDRIFINEWSGEPLHPALQAHEAVHCERQLNHLLGVEGWWYKYLNDKAFRLEEERLAHIAELRWHNMHAKSRNERRWWAGEVAKRFASPLYGHLVTEAKAKALLIAGLKA